MDPRPRPRVALLGLLAPLALACGSSEGAHARQDDGPPRSGKAAPGDPASPEAVERDTPPPVDVELTWTVIDNPRPLANAAFGHACAVGDLDGDGHADLLVGAPGSGTLYVFPGRAGDLPDPATWRALQAGGTVDERFQPQGDAFGSALALGQLDGDRALEVVVGAPARGNQRGRVYTVGVGDDPWAVAEVPTGTEPLGRLGHAVAVADLDGDGVGEVVAGAPATVREKDPRGAVLVVHRGRPLVLRSPRPSRNANFGHDFAVTRPPGERRDDLLVSAVGNTVAGVELMGEVLHFRGALFDPGPREGEAPEGHDPFARYTSEDVPGFTAPTQSAEDLPRFGMSVHASRRRLAVGSPRHDRPDVLDAGQAFTWDLDALSPDGETHPTLLLRPSPRPNDVHGFRVRVGDLLGRGEADVLVACLPSQRGEDPNPYSLVLYPGGRDGEDPRPLLAPPGARDHWIQGAAVGALRGGSREQVVAGDPTFDGERRRGGRVAIGDFQTR